MRRPLKSRRFVRDESGQTAAEYVALILAVVILLAFGGYVLNGALHISMNGISNWTGSIDPPGAPQGPGGASAQGQGGAGPAPGGQGSGGGVSRSQGGAAGKAGPVRAGIRGVSVRDKGPRRREVRSRLKGARIKAARRRRQAALARTKGKGIRHRRTRGRPSPRPTSSRWNEQCWPILALTASAPPPSTSVTKPVWPAAERRS